MDKRCCKGVGKSECWSALTHNVSTKTGKKMRSIKRIAAAAAMATALGVATPAFSADGFWKRSYAPDQPINKFKEASDRFDEADKAAATSESIENNGKYLRSGIVLSNLACTMWLDTLGRADRDASFAKDIMNIVGNLIIGVAGINGANPNSLARGSLALAAGNGSIDAFKNEVILGALADIEAKLNEGRQITAATIKANTPPYFDDAKAMLLAYHRDCSPNAVKILLKTSLAAVKYEPANTSLNEAVNKAKITGYTAQLLRDIFPGDGNKGVSEDDLYKLYVTQIAAPGFNPPAFVTSMQTAESQALSAAFAASNNAERLGWLQSIADIKKFGERYNRDKLNASIASAAALRNKESEAAAIAQSVVKAKESLSKSEGKKAETSEEAKQFYASPASTPLNKELVNSLKTGASQVPTKTPGAKALETEIAKLELKQAEVDAARQKLEKANAAPAAPSTPAPVKSAVGAPISVNAVLVPVAKDN